MGETSIEIDSYENEVWITNNSYVSMYAGDRGTKVYATIRLDKTSLKNHICKLIKEYRLLCKEEKV